MILVSRRSKKLIVESLNELLEWYSVDNPKHRDILVALREVEEYL